MHILEPIGRRTARVGVEGVKVHAGIVAMHL